MRRDIDRRLAALRWMKPRRLPSTGEVLAKLGFPPEAKAADVAAGLGMTIADLQAKLRNIARE